MNKAYEVDQEYFWRPIAEAPLGRKIQLLNLGKVAIHGTLTEKDRKDYLGWTPLPKIPKGLE